VLFRPSKCLKNVILNVRGCSEHRTSFRQVRSKAQNEEYKHLNYQISNVTTYNIKYHKPCPTFKEIL